MSVTVLTMVLGQVVVSNFNQWITLLKTMISILNLIGKRFEWRGVVYDDVYATALWNLEKIPDHDRRAFVRALRRHIGRVYRDNSPIRSALEAVLNCPVEEISKVNVEDRCMTSTCSHDVYAVRYTGVHKHLQPELSGDITALVHDSLTMYQKQPEIRKVISVLRCYDMAIIGHGVKQHGYINYGWCMA